MIKGKGQRLIPEELLKYLEAYKENHPDPAGGGGATLEDIVDSAGNKRFIEGNGTLGEIEGLTFTYNKWSLSGTHLMIVLAGTVTATTIINNTTFCVYENIPDYIMNKLVASWFSGTVVDIKTAVFRNLNDNGTSTLNLHLKKEDNKLYIKSYGSLTNSSSAFRIQFDLLIDTD